MGRLSVSSRQFFSSYSEADQSGVKVFTFATVQRHKRSFEHDNFVEYGWSLRVSIAAQRMFSGVALQV